MTRTLMGAAALATLITSAALAVEPGEGARLGTEPGAISAALGESGWDMTRYQRKDGGIELTVVKEDRRMEAYLDRETGEVARVEERARRGRWPLPGADDAQIRARIAADGYEIVRYERGRGRIEVYADRDGQRWELEIDPRDGHVLEIEREDQ